MVELDRLRGYIRICMYLDHLPSEGHVPGPGKTAESRRHNVSTARSNPDRTYPTTRRPRGDTRSTVSARQALYAEGWQYGIFYRNGL